MQPERGGEGRAIAQNTEITGGSERVLVVEDEPQVRASVVLQLQSLGYAVDEASDATEAIAALQAASPPFDLMLTDVVMPGALNGEALAEEALHRWPKTKVVFMSGYSDNALTKNGELKRGVLLLRKPFRKADLARAIRRGLDGSDTQRS